METELDEQFCKDIDSLSDEHKEILLGFVERQKDITRARSATASGGFSITTEGETI